MHYFLYALTLLTSSSLLFVVQPMVAKMIQPILGGSPAVWNTAMVFFQALLLGGYLYAHITTRWLGTRRQAVLHLVIMLVGLVFLPVAFHAPVNPTDLQTPALWLLITLCVGVGWPFFVVSASAPLFQKWFSTTDHPRAADPYHLYAASNLGSVLALVAYPFWIEPHIGLAAQSILWTVAYLVLCAAVALCAAALWKSSPPEQSQKTTEIPPAGHLPLTWRRRGRWLLWAFIPSSMMLSVTTFITTDIAPVPMLWIPPLTIYIVSFIAVFARRQPVPPGFWLLLFPPLLAASAALLVTNTVDPLWSITAVNFIALLVFCMVFHGFLAKDRPHTGALTEFYLWLAVGGVVGGIFNALLAPLIFDRLLEYPIVLLVAVLAVPGDRYRRRSLRFVMTCSLLVAGAFIVHDYFSPEPISIAALGIFVIAFLIPAIVCNWLWRWTPLIVGFLLTVVTAITMNPEANEIYAERSFFGTHRVMQTSSGNHHVLYHGRTIHGAQASRGEFRGTPLTYYYPAGPLGQVFEELDRRNESHPIAAVGLGTGAVAAYAQSGQTMDIIEIDPVVKEIATNPDFFTYIEDCRGFCEITIGDGRLRLEAADDNRYEVIVLDAYSSAAVPVHLLTREAIAIYMQKLRHDGILAIHISSPYLDMEPPLTRAAADLGLVSRIQEDFVDEDDPIYLRFVDSSEWLIIARTSNALGKMATDERWLDLEPVDDVRAWTDDYANLLGAYRFSTLPK